MDEVKKPIAGFKAAELDAPPEKVFGDDVRIEELPEGIRLYLKDKAIDLSTRQMIVNVYRLVDEGGMKRRRKWAAKFTNRIPREDEVAEQCGGGFFVWIAKWSSTVDNRERGLMSEEFEIDEEMGKAAHEAWMRSQRGAAASTPAAPAPAPQGALGGDVTAILRIMDAAEEKTLARIERISAMFKGSQGPAEVLEGAYKSASEMMQKAVEMNTRVAAKAAQKQIEQMDEEEETEADAPAGDAGAGGPQLPAWLRPFMPQIEMGINKLLGGGPAAGMVKELVLSSEEWKSIFNDKDKWGQFVAAMEMQFGSERAGKALDLLLGKSGGGAVAKAAARVAKVVAKGKRK